MHPTFKRTAIAALLAPALALPAALQAQDRAQDSQQRQSRTQDAGKRDQSRQYRNLWSAEELIDTNVRGANGEEIGEVKDIIVGQDGRINRVVVEVGGFLEMGDQHIGVPWNDVQIGPDMQWVQVPLREVESGTYSLYGLVPQGEDVLPLAGAWRVNELIGDYASLRDIPRYGMVSDILFNQRGEAVSVIVNRTAGAWGTGGWYDYPYAGYYPGAYAYPLPYRSAELRNDNEFDYLVLVEQSPLAGNKSAQRGKRQQQAQAHQGKQGSAASGGATAQQSQSSQDQQAKPAQGEQTKSQASSDSAATGSSKQPAVNPGGSMTDPVKTQRFSALDTDNDGTLSMMEAAADPDAKQQFKELDKNNDYKLSRSEYEALEKRTPKTAGAAGSGDAAAGATGNKESKK